VQHEGRRPLLSELDAVLLRVASDGCWDICDRAPIIRPQDQGTVASYEMGLAVMPVALRGRWNRFTATADMIMDLPLARQHVVER
jgi:hypothetical protein